MNTKPICPECGRGLTFAPDGRSRLCELCGYKETIQREIPPPEELVRGLRFAAQFSRGTEEPSVFRSNTRLLLVQANGAAKDGDYEEVYFCLDKLLHTDADDKVCAEAWLLLSQIYQRPEQRRVCLEQALAHQPTNPLARREIAILDGRLQQSDIINPDHVRAETTLEEPQTIHAEHFQCPRCAARMNYTPDGQALVCGYCDYRQELADRLRPDTDNRFGAGAGEQDFIAALATARGHLPPVAMRAFHCMGCGIEFVLGPETLSMTCPYCDSVYVTEAAEARQIHPPQALIPFAFGDDQVKLALRAWFKAHKVERPRVSPVAGVYLPVWTFDVGGEVRWNGRVRRGDDWVAVSGTKQLLVDDLLIPATDKLPARLTNVLTTFDFTALVAYDARYLADWPAERYQLALAEASLQARKQVLGDLRKRPYDLSAAEQIRDLTFSSGGLTIESFKLILLPLWMIHYKLDDTVYHILINGQNGTICGQYPQNAVGKIVSWLKGG